MTHEHCPACKGLPHHWIQDEKLIDGGVYNCLHCPATGYTCPHCDGDGIDKKGAVCTRCEGACVVEDD